MTMVNEYSAPWFSTFLLSVPAEQTAREIEFLERQLPVRVFPRLLDLCCGAGRHAAPLAERGYRVTGVDRSDEALELARRASARVEFVQADMRELSALRGPFDAVICLWQSFGHFDDAENAHVLRAMRRLLRPRGRLVLDIYNRAFFEAHPHGRRTERNGRVIEETRELRDGRLSVRLSYGDGSASDRFEWRLYSEAEIVEVAAAQGLALLLACREFDPAHAPGADAPRMQLVFERADERPSTGAEPW